MWWNKLFGKATTPLAPAGTISAKDNSGLKVIVKTDLGNIRTNNEDTGLYFRVADDSIIQEKGCLLIVADGMGGHQAGEVASKMAADTISKEYFSNNGNVNIEKNLARVFSLANKNIFETAAADKALNGMGTTCTALIIHQQAIYYAHVGDSRAYLIKNQRISRITTDHTYVQELLKNGDITPAEADKHPQRNILTNAMGTKAQVQVDTGKYNGLLEENDRVLICSDGLYDYLEDAEIASIVNSAPVEAAAETLVATAKKRGGHDNITVVLAEKTGPAMKASKQTRDFILPVTKEIDLP